jgi:hypothetical protein|tara:strand:+ start:48 stop:227 length:180 start_codon:yes stop_codon:yes gene_type:complete
MAGFKVAKWRVFCHQKTLEISLARFKECCLTVPYQALFQKLPNNQMDVIGHNLAVFVSS